MTALKLVIYSVDPAHLRYNLVSNFCGVALGQLVHSYIIVISFISVEMIY